MSAEITIKELYHDFGAKNVLNGIELEIKEGEIFGLLGPSGAGKTTLINILTGQLTPQRGTATLFGKEVGLLKGNDYVKIGIMMDHFGLYERMNCYDNLKFYEMLDGKSDIRFQMYCLMSDWKKRLKPKYPIYQRGCVIVYLLQGYYYEVPELCFWMNLPVVWTRPQQRVYMN